MLTLEYRVLKKLYPHTGLPIDDLMRLRKKKPLYMDAALHSLKDAGWISGSLDAYSTVSITRAGRIEYLRAKQKRLSWWEDLIRYLVSTLVAVVAAFFAGVAAFHE